jgi:hypothetical protein
MVDNSMLVEPNALLTGGPTRPWEVSRHVPESVSKLKLCYGPGYEHYVRTGETVVVSGQLLSVFAWATSTKVAE